MDRQEKEELVSILHQELSESALVVVSTNAGMTVSEVSDLRRKMRDAGANYRVAKNTLARLSIVGTPSEAIRPLLSGPTGLAYSKDPVAAAKVTVQFSNGNDKFKVIGGVLNGNLLTGKEVEALSKLPSMDELRAKILAVIATPATRVAGVVQAPAAQLARVFSAYGKTA